MRASHLLRLSGLIVASVFLLSACSKAVAPPKPDPTVVSVTVNATGRINIDSRARATPVVVRTYLLKNGAAFDSADFFSLFERDQQVLGDALVAREEIVVQPGETRTLEAREVEGAKVFAVLAAFRDVDRATWRASAPIVANRVNEMSVNLQENRVTVSTRLGAATAPGK